MKKLSLRVQISLILLVFMGIVLSLIYFFQTSLLDYFYKENKIQYLQNVASDISNNIQDDDIVDVLDNLSLSNEICIRIEGSSFGVSKYKQSSSCALNKLSSKDISNMMELTSENGGSKLFDNFIFRTDGGYKQNIYIYGKTVNIAGETMLIMVSSNIAPLQATVQTISDQFKVIILIVCLATLVLALVMAAIIARPVKRIEKEANNLPRGKYNKFNINTECLELDNLNNTLDNANREILKADIARKELIGNVSHDLRTPLTMIVGYGEMIRDLPSENNEENINVIIDEAKRLSTLVDDLLDVSKIESGKIELHKKDVSLNDLLNSVYKQYEQFCLSKNVKFTLNLCDDVTVNIDENRIKQVLYNFINNALNYNDSLDKEIELGCYLLDNGKHRVYVYDNGSGIDPKNIDKIWDRYYKVDKEHKRVHLGSGIGLSLSRDILEASNIEYGVDSKLDEYSKFYFDV